MTTGLLTPEEGSGPVLVRRPSRGRVIALLIAGLVLVAAAGVATGIVLERSVLSRRAEAANHARRGAGSRRGAMHERFGHDLNLTPTQELKIDSIFASHRPTIDSARAVSEPAIRAIIDQTRREIDSVLTPAQRAKLHERIRREHPSGDSLSPDGVGRARF